MENTPGHPGAPARTVPVSAASEHSAPAVSSKANRVATVVLDGLCGLVGVGAVTYLVVGLASPWLPVWGLIFLTAWTGLVSLMALPAVVVLYFSAPRVPLRQRSALIASASWFGRAVWASAIFALSIVIGSVAGVVASTANESGQDDGDGLVLAIEATASLILWPAILTVIAVAYVVVAARWALDIGTIVAEDGGTVVRALLERRWTGPLRRSSTGLVDILIEVIIAVISRAALVLTLITVGLTVVFTATNWQLP